MRWAEFTSRHIADIPPETVCVLPLGATEQRGPHLPLDSDRLIAESIAERLDVACDKKLLTMPSVSVKCSEHRMTFAGTLSFEHATLQDVVRQAVRSAARHGFRRFLLLNAHGGNMAAGGIVAEQSLRTLPDCDIVFATWLRAADSLRPVVEDDYPAVEYACEFETSLVMAIPPDLMDRDEICDDGIPAASPLMRSDLLPGASATRSIPFDRSTSIGVWAKPSLASVEKGQAMLDVFLPTINELDTANWPDFTGNVTAASQTEGFREHDTASPPGGTIGRMTQ